MAAAPRNLRQFVDQLAREGELVEVEAEVDADLEVAEVHRRVIAAGGPALLFRNVRGKSWPLVTNLFGTARRIELAFGPRPEQLVAEVARLPEELVPPTLGKLWQKRGLLASLARVGMRRSRRGPITANIHTPPALSRLPALRTWERDGGPFVTLPLVYTEHPETGGSNLGMYRIQLFSDDEVGVHFQIGKGGGFHLAAAEQLRRPLPVHVHVGGPPALMLSAIAPLPENVPELLLASLAQGSRLDLASSPLDDLPVISEADFCIVGEITPGARRPEGPFGDHYGYYSEVHDYPWMKVNGLLARDDAIFPATVVGKPRQEDFFLGDYLQDLLTPMISLAMPAVRSLWSYGETGYHSLSAAVTHDRYEREALATGFRILGEGQLSLTKFLILTDAPIDLRDFPAVLRHVLARADFRSDLFVFAHLAMDSLDYAGPRINRGSKGILVGLGEARRELPREFTGEPHCGVTDVRVFTDGCLVVEGPPAAEDSDLAQRVANDPAFGEWPLIVLSDDAARATRSSMNFLWTTFTRFDPAADITARSVELLHAHASFDPPVVIDARMKPGYPAELSCDPQTAGAVERRWSEYFPAHRVEMGDSEAGHLD